MDSSAETTSSQLVKNKINKAFLELLNNEDSKVQFTPIILSHIRTLSLEVNRETIDRLLVNQLNQNFIKQKETILSEQTDSTIVANFLWLLQTHGRNVEDSPYILEEITDYVAMEEDNSVYRQRDCFFYTNLLTTGVHIFSFYPSETQHILGKIFELCKSRNNLELEEKVVFYSKLLRCESFYSQRVLKE